MSIRPDIKEPTKEEDEAKEFGEEAPLEEEAIPAPETSPQGEAYNCSKTCLIEEEPVEISIRDLAHRYWGTIVR